MVDHSGRGRSGFNPTALNRARAEGNAGALPDIQIAPRERAWWFFRIGADLSDPVSRARSSRSRRSTNIPHSSCPTPRPRCTAPAPTRCEALAALLDKIGPAVVMVHSQSGAYGLNLVRARAAKMLAFVNVEGNCAPVTAGRDRQDLLQGPAARGLGRLQPRRARAERRRAPQRLRRDRQRRSRPPAAPPSSCCCPRPASKGNSHMLMMDKNNLQIADLIIGWLGESATAEQPKR